MKFSRKIIILIILALVSAGPLAGETSLSLLDIENLNGTSDLDYLKGMISGLLLFDLSSAGGIDLVDRRNLEDILAEQSLQLSGVTEDRDSLLEIGRIGAADFLLKGTYVFLGTELLVSLSLLDTVTGNQKTFTARGHTENMVHGLAEDLILHVTGGKVEIRDPNSVRSILSMKDETPGKITFYSRYIGAEIWLDGEFFGYTSGNSRVPVILDNLKPGLHTLVVKAGRDFGMVNTPEFTFEPWHTGVEIVPGGNRVVRDGTVDYNSFIYDAMQLIRESRRLPDGFTGNQEFAESFSYIDLEGNPVEGECLVTVEADENRIEAASRVILGDSVLDGNISVSRGEEEEFEGRIGNLEWEIEGTYSSYGRIELDYTLRRRDIRQGMYRD